MEIVAGIAGSIAGKLADYFFKVPGRQLGYLVHYNDNIRSLRKQAEKLTDIQETVQGKIDAAKRNNEQIEACVQKWVDEVKIITGDGNKFLDDEVKADKRCLNGWCINLSSRYRLSKEAQQKTFAISELQQEEERFESVSFPAPPPGIISASSAISDGLLSRQLLESEVMEALKDDNVSMIGICGMGGVGKTTLVKKIGKQAEEDKLFDKVVMAVVAVQNPKLTKIQGEIANMLGLALDGEDESARARLLWKRIKNEKRILVILDDVWGRLELDRVGIPWGDDHKGCKIVLTSRSKDVCGDMNAKKIFTVEELLDKESWDLFRDAAGEVVDSSDIYPIARKVAAKCGGLPLAILTVGKALKNKNSKYEWNDAANQLKKSVPTNIRGVEKEVILPLKLSYDYLESEEAKSCFLLCCLFPEDFEIPVEALVRYGWGLSLFQAVDTVEEARGRAHTLVNTLIASHLLLEGDGCVRMHDVVHAVAIWIASKDKINFMVKAGIELKDWPKDENFKNFTGISLMSNNIHELSDGLECRKLQTLLLQRNSPLKIHDMFFQGMKELKVLDMSGIRPLSPPPSLSVVANLRTLHLEDCELGDISEIGKLIKLEILSFSRSDIKEIPKHFGQLSRLRLFDLSFCRELTLISPGVISSLSRLEELSMRGSFRHWDVNVGDSRSNASLFELQALPGLTSLHIRIPNASSLPTHMPFQHLTTFTISIGNTEEFSYVADTYSRALSLTHDTKIPLLGWVKNLIERTEYLHLSRFIGLRNIIPNLDNNEFNELKSLSIHNCKEMNYLVNTLEWPPQKAFHSLELLSLQQCEKLKTVFPPSLLQSLINLETLGIRDCPNLEEIFGKQKKENKDPSPVSTTFPNLTRVYIYNCEKLKTVFPPSLLQSLINLDEIEITGCYNLEEIFGKQEKEEEGKEIVVWNKDPTSVSPTFPNLTRVTLWHCKKLRNLFSPSIVRALAQLQELRVAFCGMMQEIVSDEEREEGASMETIVFPRLTQMSLYSLDSLTSFCPGRRYTFEWPALEELRIVACPKMETFGYGDQVTPKLENVFGDEWLWMGDLNVTVRVQYLFKNPGP